MCASSIAAGFGLGGSEGWKIKTDSLWAKLNQCVRERQLEIRVRQAERAGQDPVS